MADSNGDRERQRQQFDYLRATFPFVEDACFGLKPGEYPSGMTRFDLVQFLFTLANPQVQRIVAALQEHHAAELVEHHVDRILSAGGQQ